MSHNPFTRSRCSRSTWQSEFYYFPSLYIGPLPPPTPLNMTKLKWQQHWEGLDDDAGGGGFVHHHHQHYTHLAREGSYGIAHFIRKLCRKKTMQIESDDRIDDATARTETELSKRRCEWVRNRRGSNGTGMPNLMCDLYWRDSVRRRQKTQNLRTIFSNDFDRFISYAIKGKYI